MTADVTTRPETPTLWTQNYPVFVVLQTLLGVCQKRNLFCLLIHVFQFVHWLSWTNIHQSITNTLPDGLLLLMYSLSRSGGRFLSPTVRGEFPREVSKDRNHLSGSHIPSGLKIKQHRLHCKAWHLLALNPEANYSSSKAASFFS